jgi:hydroxyatrazine ethylaminohydrolase
MRTAWMMQAFYSKERGGCISPYEMPKIATVNGAKTLGRPDWALERRRSGSLYVDVGFWN